MYQPIKIFKALVAQSGTDDPVLIVLENTIGEIDLLRISTGYYQMSSNELFIENKTTILHKSIVGDSWDSQMTSYRIDNSIIGFSTTSGLSGVLSDSLINYPELIQIEVYPELI